MYVQAAFLIVALVLTAFLLASSLRKPHDCPSRREMMATRDACDALDQRVDNHYRELRELRGRVNAMRRWEKADEQAAGIAPEVRQDAPGPTNGQRRVMGAPQIPRRNY